MVKNLVRKISRILGAFLLLVSPALQFSPFITKVQAATPPAQELVFSLLAAGERTSVIAETTNNVTTLNNGTEWYYTPAYGSMGFAPQGAIINQNSADVNGQDPSDPTSTKRLSWHTSSGNLESGYRSGLNTGLYENWNRYVYQANTLPSYYPSGPQENVSQSSLTGWTLCYQGTYAESASLASLFSTCSGQYLLYASSTNESQKLDVTQNGTSLLLAVGGNYDTTKRVYPGSNVNLSLYENDGTTLVNWNTFRAYVTNCNVVIECDPNNPYSDPENWDDGTVTTSAYTIPSGSENKLIAFYPADDETGEFVPGTVIKIFITKIPETHLISNCAQLMSMDTDFGAGSEKDIYKLTQNIDCSGTENLEPLVWNEDFAGEFNGQGYTISNLDLVDENNDGSYGLISRTNGAIVKNINIIDSTITGTYTVGSFVGFANQSTFSNLNSSATIIANSSYVGGLIGEAEESSIINSSASGDVVGDLENAEYVGGLIGGLWDSELSYSYATGQVQGDWSVGGLIGEGDGSTIMYSVASGFVKGDGSGAGGFIGRNQDGNEIYESYATGSVEGYTRVGGFAGANGGYIENSFARGNVQGVNNVGGFAGRCGNEIYSSYSTGTVTGDSDTGGFLGYDAGCYVENSYWDVDTSGVSESALGDPKTTQELKTLETFSTWDFDSVWVLDPASNDGYPSFIRLGEDNDLDNIPNITEQLGPNSGDADDDGIADRFQENVTSLPNSTDGNYIALKTNCGTGTANKEVTVSKEDTAKTDAAYSYQQGLISFKTQCPTVGSTATITLYFYGVTSKDGRVLRKFNPITGAYTLISDANITLESIAGRSVLKAVYQITDGGVLDQDGIADGIITDPVGTASLIVSVPNTGL